MSGFGGKADTSRGRRFWWELYIYWH